MEMELCSSLLPFDGVNPRSVVIASIHHADSTKSLEQLGVLVYFLPP